MKLFSLTVLALALSACCSSPSPEHLAVKQWTPAEQRQILAEEKKLPPNSILIPLIDDYAKLRREAE